MWRRSLCSCGLSSATDMTTVIGIDPSMTATGIAVWRNGSAYAYTSTSPADEDATLRWNRHLAKIFGEIDDPQRTFIAVEDLPKGKIAVTALLIERAGLLALIRYGAARRGVPVALINPSTLKKFATGHGQSSKAAMRASARLLLGVETDNDNEADAVWLQTMAMLQYGIPCNTRNMTVVQLDSLDV